LMIYCRQSRDVILKARNRGIQKLMPNAVFRECGKSHGSLFQPDAPALAETKDFIERLDPPRDRASDDPPAHIEQARMEQRIEAATR